MQLPATHTVRRLALGWAILLASVLALPTAAWANICDRTPEVADAIVAFIEDDTGTATTCDAVTTAQLATVDNLAIRDGYSSNSIVPSDFAGLTGLTDLEISNSRQLTTVPADAFSELADNTGFIRLSLTRTAIDTIHVDAFDGLDDLTLLKLEHNYIQVLEESVFADLSSLDNLNLKYNLLTSIHKDLFDGLDALKKIELLDNRLTELHEETFDDVGDTLTRLTLGRNHLSHLPKELFEPLGESLDALHIEGNNIAGLDEDIFEGLSDLREIYLNGNDLTELPADIFEPLDESLRTLNLSANDLGSLPADIFDGLSDLGSLNLSYTGLTELDDNIFAPIANPVFRYLYLHGNNLTTLPAGIFNNLSGLRYLYLHGNNLTTLPAGIFTGLDKLERLFLYGNNLETLPENVFAGLGSLQYLYLSGNSLTTLPEDLFDDLDRMRQLYLHGNRLTSLPANIFADLDDATSPLPLQTLLLNDNNFSANDALPADVFDGLTGLLYLYLHRSDLTALPAGIFTGLSGLQRLYLHGNDLTTLPADVFDGLTGLQRLYLNGNGLTELPANRFDELANLQQLFLTNNSIPSLPAAVFTGLSGLQQLDLSCNALTALDLIRFDPFAASLTFLDIRSNAFTTAPTEAALTTKLTAIQNLYFQGDNTDCLLPYDAGLSALSLSTGTLLPEFEAPGLTSYTTFIGGDVSSMTITPTPLDPGAVIEPPSPSPNYLIDNDETTPGVQAELKRVTQRVDWVVRARDGVTTLTYRLNVFREHPPASNAVLHALTLSSLELRPAFDSSTLTYWASVPSTPTPTTVTATGLDPDATVVIKRDGVEVSGALALAADTETTLTIEVTAEDGTTTRTYTVRVIPSGLAREVPADWALVPPGLAPGERFRLLFVTSTRRNATATDISDYDAFIQAAVRASGRAALAEYADHFRVLGSTASVDALGHVGLSGAGELIWWLGAGSMEAYDVSGRVSGKVAGTAADFFDGRWAHPAAIRTERGDRIPDADLAAVKVFTGTASDGTAVVGRQLGNQTGVVVDAFDSQSTRTTPLNDGQSPQPRRAPLLRPVRAVYRRAGQRPADARPGRRRHPASGGRDDGRRGPAGIPPGRHLGHGV